jgi:hypothetical protein
MDEGDLVVEPGRERFDRIGDGPHNGSEENTFENVCIRTDRYPTGTIRNNRFERTSYHA